MSEVQKPKRQRATDEQRRLLVEMVEDQEDVIFGRSTGPEYKLKRQQYWLNASNQLNSLGGAQRSAKEWEKCLRDMKVNAKKGAQAKRTYFTGTGGGPAMPHTSDTDLNERLINAIGGQEIVEGNLEVVDPLQMFEEVPLPLYLINSEPTEASNPINISANSEQAPPSAANHPAAETLRPPSATTKRADRKTRKREARKRKLEDEETAVQNMEANIASVTESLATMAKASQDRVAIERDFVAAYKAYVEFKIGRPI